MKLQLISTLLFIICFFQFSCTEISHSTSKEKISLFEEETKLNGFGNGIGSVLSNWSLTINSDNSIILQEIDLRNSQDIHFLNLQYFGSIIESKKYTYELIITDAIYGSGCDKPDNKFLDSDTIPVYIDDSLFTISPSWRLQTKDTIIEILESPYFFTSESPIDQVLTLIPDSNSHYQTMSLHSGRRCGVVLGNQSHNQRFYLNDNNGYFELIIKDSMLIELYGEKCTNCIREIELTEH